MSVFLGSGKSSRKKKNPKSHPIMKLTSEKTSLARASIKNTKSSPCQFGINSLLVIKETRTRNRRKKKLKRNCNKNCCRES